MENFKDYLAHKDSMTMPSAESTQKIVNRYPWFSSARLVLMQLTGKEDERLKLQLQTRSCPDIFLKKIHIDDFRKRSTIEIIDTFLSKGDHKIVPDDTTPEYDFDAQFIADQEDFVSEDLAEVFARQGMIEQAKATYMKLSLLYPKKSVYFAQIIEALDSDNTNNENL